jgi:hypothetical protein
VGSTPTSATKGSVVSFKGIAMTSLEATKNAVEELYDDVLSSRLLKGEDEDCCNCDDGKNCQLCTFLSERIKKNLRMVLCDVILLKNIRSDTILE